MLKARGRKPIMEIYDEIYDPRIHGEAYRKFILSVWESAGPKWKDR